MSSRHPLEIAQEILTRYGMMSYLIIGDIGLIFNILYFTQASQRRNPCSLYLVASAICRLVTLNVAVIPILYALDHPNYSNISLIFCKLQYYFRHAPNQMMRTFIVLACIDRYALCSMRPRMRAMNRFSVAIKLIPVVVIFWLLGACFIPIFQTIQNGRCGRYDSALILAYTIYNLATSGLFPPISMIVFGILVIRSLHQIRARIQPTNGSNTQSVLRKADRDLIRMSLVEVIIYIITTTPYTIILIYLFATRSMTKSNEHKKIESFIAYLAESFLLHLNNALPFWILLITLQSFRNEFKTFLMKRYAKLIGRTVVITGQSMTMSGKAPPQTGR